MTAAVLDTVVLKTSLRRSESRRRNAAIALTIPLLLFLAVTLLVPIAALLQRAIENPEVARALPRTGEALAGWDRQAPPPAAAFAAVAADLGGLAEGSEAGALARRLNSEVSGARSLIMGTFRALPLGENLTPEQTRQKMLEVDERWNELRYWQAIAKNSSRWTPDYLLTAVDLRRGVTGGVEAVAPEQRVFGRILLRTFEISLVVTLIALLLAYPLAYWLSTLPAHRANMLMILVLVPF